MTAVIVFTQNALHVVGIYKDEDAIEQAIFENSVRGNVLAVTRGIDNEGENYIRPIETRVEPYEVDIRA